MLLVNSRCLVIFLILIGAQKSVSADKVRVDQENIPHHDSLSHVVTPVISEKTKKKYPVTGISNSSMIFESMVKRTEEYDVCSDADEAGGKECDIEKLDLGPIKIASTHFVFNEKNRTLAANDISIFGIDFPFAFVYYSTEEKISFSENVNVGFLQLAKGMKIELEELLKAIAAEIVSRQDLEGFEPRSASFSLEESSVEAVAEREFTFAEIKFPAESVLGIVAGRINKITPSADLSSGGFKFAGQMPVYFSEHEAVIEAVYKEKEEGSPVEKQFLKRFRAGKELYRIDLQSKQISEKSEGALKVAENFEPAGFIEKRGADRLDISFYKENLLLDYPQVVTLIMRDGRKVLARPISYLKGREGDCGGGGGVYVRYNTFFGEDVSDAFLAIPGVIKEQILVSKKEFDVVKVIENLDEFAKEHDIARGPDLQMLKHNGLFYLENASLPNWSLIYLFAGHDSGGQWLFYKKKKVFHLDSKVLTQIKIGETILFWGGSGDDMQSSDTLAFWYDYDGEWLVHVQRSTAEYCMC